METSEPTLVLYKSAMCKHCTALSNIWDKAPNKDDDSVTDTLKKVYPKLRFYVITAKDNTGKFDENTAPKDLMRYSKWFPMILLIPGKLWDSAMSKLGPKNPVELVDGVQIMNGFWDKNDLKYQQKYDIRKPSEFARWLKDSLENEDFKKAQFSSTINSAGMTIPIATGHSSQPILSNIIRPTTNYVAGGSTERYNPMDIGDVCSMRIISRPK